MAERVDVVTDSDEDAPPAIFPHVEVDLNEYSADDIEKMRGLVREADKAERDTKVLLSEARAGLAESTSFKGSVERALALLQEGVQVAARERKVTAKERKSINAKKEQIKRCVEQAEVFSQSKREFRLSINSSRREHHKARSILAALDAVADGWGKRWKLLPLRQRGAEREPEKKAWELLRRREPEKRAWELPPLKRVRMLQPVEEGATTE